MKKELPRCLELATYLTNEWSLSSEVCEDMEITTKRLKMLSAQARDMGIGIDREDGKIRLSFKTTVDLVRMAVE
tara:strand:- start:3597 stop:3818 length:222 start_codon:yes stop_codon:yes gene_type:complete